MRKKGLGLLALTLVFALALVACGGGGSDETTQATTEATTTTTVAATKDGRTLVGVTYTVPEDWKEETSIDIKSLAPSTTGMTVDGAAYTYNNGNGTYFIIEMTATNTLTDAQKQQVLDAAREGAMSSMSANISETKDETIAGQPAKVAVFSATQSGQTINGEFATFSVGNSMYMAYVLEVNSSTEDVDENANIAFEAIKAK